MKTLRFLILGLLAATTICRAQNTQPGWFNVQSLARPAITPMDSNIQAQVTAYGLFTPSGQPNVPSTPVAEVITPQIQALANGLQNDPLRIFNYVHDHINHVFYFGSKKGAQLTLLEKSGNDFDQCALLTALLNAAGYTNTQYQFGWVLYPYDNSDGSHQDLHHWLQLTLTNSSSTWLTTSNYLANLIFYRGYPTYAALWGNNVFAFQHVWVTLVNGSTTNYLDPSFKVYEPVTGINLSSAMGFSSNSVSSAAAGTDTGTYVTGLNEAAVRSTLTGYTTNLLGYMQSNYPNASPQQILGGWRIVPSTNTTLRTNFLFTTYDFGGVLPILSWNYEPTNMMSRLSITFAGTNYQWFMPQFQGQRLSLTYDTNGLAQLWQDDTLLAQKSTASTDTNVGLFAHHPVGNWNPTNNTFIDNGAYDQITTNAYQRTSATYALLYAFEPDWGWLQARQRQLDNYRQQGLADTSRQVVSETLNIMGLNWMLQTEGSQQLLCQQLSILPMNFHRIGRMAQEIGKGYYVDAYMEQDSDFENSGLDAVSVDHYAREFELKNYFNSALESGIIEQLQNTNLPAASTVKMLEIANTNGQAVYMAYSGNWSTVAASLVNYDTPTLNSIYNNYISQGAFVMLPQNGANQLAGAGSWSGYGYLALGNTMAMIISGGYHGGYSALPGLLANPPYVDMTGDNAPQYYASAPTSTPNPQTADPVDTADDTFHLQNADLSSGQAEPRGITLSRYYNGTRRYSNAAGMAGGWIHNYSINANTVAAPQAGLGGTTPAQMAAMLVASCATVGYYNDSAADPKNWMVTALIAKWGIDQLTRSGVSVNLGQDMLQFVQQPNGVYTPPANSTMTLTQSGTAYTLLQRHGNTFKFDSLGRLTNIVDQYSNSMSLTYNSSNWVNTVTDWKNRTFTFNYTGTPSRLTSVSDGTRTVSYGYSTTYNSQGDLTSFTDAESKTSTYMYDTNHQVTATLDAQSRLVVSNLYDSQGHVTTQYAQGDTNKTWRIYWSGWETKEFDPANGELDFLYDDAGRLISMFDQLHNETDTYYDGQNHITNTVSPLRETTKYVYDGNNNLVQILDPLGFTNQLVYDNQNNLIRSIDPSNKTNTFGYNAQFSMTGATNGAGDFVNYSFNTDGTLASRTDSGGTTTYGYDSTYKQLASITYPNSLGVETFANNSFGDITNHTDARSFATAFQYNLRRQLTNTIAPSNLVTRIAYDAVGNAASVTDPRGNLSSNIWSPTRHLLATTLPTVAQGVPVVTNVYDNRDWLIRSLDPLQKATQFTNDANGQLIASTDPVSRTTTFVYDSDGHKTAITNAAGEVTGQTWDARGKLTKLTDGAGHSVLHAYDNAGNQITLTNRNGKKWQFQFDGANRLTNTITPLGRATAQAFNHQGLVASLKDPAGQTVAYSYDAKGRLTNRTDNVATTAYNYDANDNITNTSENGMTHSWTFDAYNRVTSCKDVYGNLIQYRYDANGNVTNLIYPGNKTVIYTYDNLNHLTNVMDWSGRNTAIAYDLDGRVTSIVRPNGTYRTVTYDAAGEATNILEQTALGFPIALFRLNWDTAARAQWEFAAPLPHTNAPPTRTMTYDDDNRLATVNGSSVAMDTNGNLTSGPLTNSSFTTYTYDARNRLLNVGGVTNAYDAYGNHIGLTYGTNSVSYVINSNPRIPQVLMRIKNGVTNYYIYGAGLLYQITETATATNTLTYHYDYRGSTVALTDGNGNVTDRMEYSVYGATTYRVGASDTPFLFNGRFGVMTDPNGLLYMRARYYNPYLCRFINPDPSGFSGGLNFYAYADGNPVNYLDPFGLNGWTSFFGGLRAIGGALETAAGYGLAAAGAGLSATGVGAILGVPLAGAGILVGAHGLDQVQAGARQAWTGNQVDSLTSEGLQAAGLSKNAANLTDAGISIIGSFGAGAATTAVRATELTATSISSEVANASLLTKMGYYEAGQLSLSEDAYAYYSLWPNALDRGAAMVADQGWLGAFSQSSLTLGLREGTLFTTGLPTPLASGFIGSLGGGVNAGQTILGTPGTPSPTGK